MVCGLTGAGFAAGIHDLAYYLIAVGGPAAHLYWQLSTVNLNDRADCYRKFRSNNWIGPMVLAGIMASEFPAVLQ
jgi:4-hydroxybenzoate polyprenyltransferase